MTHDPKPRRLPDDSAEWTAVEVAFPRLNPDTAESSPAPLHDVMKHVRMESADEDAQRLVFVRTALVGSLKCWSWRYTESDGEDCFVLVRQEPDGSTVLGLARTASRPTSTCWRTFYDEVYWS